jgi:hypothetical protein
MNGYGPNTGRRFGKAGRIAHPRAIRQAIGDAMRRGWRIGTRVAIGMIPGSVVGYNISARGRYVGSRYPLVIESDLGITKCHPDELTLL